MKIRTYDLTGLALDWAVHTLEEGSTDVATFKRNRWRLKYSSDWAQAGPLIEREHIAIHGNPAWTARLSFRSQDLKDVYFARGGPTPLVAAMRCFVASKLGDEVEVPDDLVNS